MICDRCTILEQDNELLRRALSDPTCTALVMAERTRCAEVVEAEIADQHDAPGVIGALNHVLAGIIMRMPTAEAK